jgi:protein-S-isoprenylcysteine O-methyltransferase Ste14
VAITMIAVPADMNRPAERLFVWLGGGAFVLALAFCAYSYLITFGVANPDTRGAGGGATFDSLHLVVDIALFTLFAGHHSMFARESVKAWIARLVPEPLLRSVYVWTASVLLIVVCRCWLPIGPDFYEATGWQAGGHAGLQIGGLALIAASVRKIDALQLAGIRAGSTSEMLQATGPYRLVRHPLYLGWMLAVFGAAHMTADRLVFATITSAYLIVAIPWEERALDRAFPGRYLQYKQQVRWRVVPFIY